MAQKCDFVGASTPTFGGVGLKQEERAPPGANGAARSLLGIWGCLAPLSGRLILPQAPPGANLSKKSEHPQANGAARSPLGIWGCLAPLSG